MWACECNLFLVATGSAHGRGDALPDHPPLTVSRIPYIRAYHPSSRRSSQSPSPSTLQSGSRACRVRRRSLLHLEIRGKSFLWCVPSDFFFVTLCADSIGLFFRSGIDINSRSGLVGWGLRRQTTSRPRDSRLFQLLLIPHRMWTWKSARIRVGLSFSLD